LTPPLPQYRSYLGDGVYAYSIGTRACILRSGALHELGHWPRAGISTAATTSRASTGRWTVASNKGTVPRESGAY
jgi:hypothetical protein